MSGAGRRDRRTVVRNGRHFLVCGLRKRSAQATRARSLPNAWLPSITLLLVLIVSAIALERPPRYPDDPQRRLPIVSVARFTVEDFVAAHQ
jgi:hypothetical protein